MWLNLDFGFFEHALETLRSNRVCKESLDITQSIAEVTAVGLEVKPSAKTMISANIAKRSIIKYKHTGANPEPPRDGGVIHLFKTFAKLFCFVQHIAGRNLVSS